MTRTATAPRWGIDTPPHTHSVSYQHLSKECLLTYQSVSLFENLLPYFPYRKKHCFAEIHMDVVVISPTSIFTYVMFLFFITADEKRTVKKVVLNAYLLNMTKSMRTPDHYRHLCLLNLTFWICPSYLL